MSGKYTLIEVTELERLRHRFDMLAHELTGDEGDDDAEIVIRRAFKEKEDELATVRNDALEEAAELCRETASQFDTDLPQPGDYNYRRGAIACWNGISALKREGGV